MFPGFPARISDMRNHFSALSAAGSRGPRAVGPSRAAGRLGPLGLRAAGPLGRWAVAGRWAAGLLLAKPVF